MSPSARFSAVRLPLAVAAGIIAVAAWFHPSVIRCALAGAVAVTVLIRAWSLYREAARPVVLDGDTLRRGDVRVALGTAKVELRTTLRGDQPHLYAVAVGNLVLDRSLLEFDSALREIISRTDRSKLTIAGPGDLDDLWRRAQTDVPSRSGRGSG